ncbi:hypothetical protein GECvBGOT_gp075 [Salmonella phage GEC_vB_GOT]|nr:hypothetical protein GECvBGOT_gp075 [Salmonella phage GEC_vB_GOT]
MKDQRFKLAASPVTSVTVWSARTITGIDMRCLPVIFCNSSSL